MQDIFIIGGGASGLVASIYAKCENNRVTILEKNHFIGKKILVTGNGRCNYWNSDQNIDHYHSANKDILEEILTLDNQEEILSFFDKIGIIPKIKNGYYYPSSNQARTILNALETEIRKRDIEIKCDTNVINIRKEGDKFLIITETDEYFLADKVILATGSKAYYQGEINSYDLALNFNHSIVPVNPALVQLITAKAPYLHQWSGIRTDVELSLTYEDTLVKKESGEIQLTDYGVSGICVFNISGLLNKHKIRKYQLLLNFVPFIKEDILNWLDKQNKKLYARTIGELLEGILPSKLVSVILSQSELSYDLVWDNLSEEQKSNLGLFLTTFPLEIVDTKGYDMAQVCSGGVALIEINPTTCESFIENGLYITGEVLDVFGDCGGYNLGFAWISGMLAGNGCRNDSDKTNKN